MVNSILPRKGLETLIIMIMSDLAVLIVWTCCKTFECNYYASKWDWNYNRFDLLPFPCNDKIMIYLFQAHASTTFTITKLIYNQI